MTQETSPEPNPLILAGLTYDQAVVYGLLVKAGPSPAGRVHKKCGLKRALTYKILDQLLAIGLVEKKDKVGQVAVFSAVHPGKIREMMEAEEKRLESAHQQASLAINGLISDYNLTAGRPNVRFYEGIEGMRQVLEDSLYSKEEILTYADIESIEKYIPEVNKAYVAKREKFGIKKRAIILDTPFAREDLANYHRDITDIKLIKYGAEPFQTVMQIYDNKVSYLTLSDQDMIGVIIEDPHIYTMHKYVFNYLWQSVPAFRKPADNLSVNSPSDSE